MAEEEVLAPDLALPVQFRDIWHGPRVVAPETILAVSVLGQTANDLQTYCFAKRRRQQRLYWEAYEWVASDDREWPYSFANLCDALHLAIEPVRAHLLGEPRANTRFRGAPRATSRGSSDRGPAQVFRLSRPANVKPMKVIRRRSSSGRRRVA